MSSLPALTDTPLDRFEALAQSLGEPAFSGRNLERWVFERRVTEFERMTDLSRSFRDLLAEKYLLRQLTVVSERADPSGTRAYLLRLKDGRTIETVLIPEDDRNTVCVSTQVGCPVACVFCASGLQGLLRNLSPGEIIEQVMLVQDRLPESERVTNVVVMGIGEPTMNLSALLQALHTWNHPRGLNLGARRITVSTVGYPKRMKRLADLKKEFGLAISLHAPRQDLRSRLVPGAGAVPLEELLQAARYYFDQTGRRVTFEYVLLADINASLREAQELCELLRGMPCNVNLIPVNPVEGLPYRRPSAEITDQFRRHLVERGITVTRRKTRGDGIAAACGQLRLREDVSVAARP